MIVLAGLVAALLQPPQEAPRLRALLPNGAVVLAEHVPAPYVVVTLSASTGGVPENAFSHGRRHLLEHLAAKGKDGTLDRRLEAEGAFLTASTGRDCVTFTVWTPPTRLDLALSALNEVIGAPSPSPESIAHESAILEQEFALETDEDRLGRAAWNQAYGAFGLDAMGSLDAIRKATPEALAGVARELFGAERIALTIVGPLDLERAVAAGRAFLAGRAKGRTATGAPRSGGTPGRVEVEGALGEARAVPVPGLLDPRTTWTLAAALAVASRFDNAFVTYTPSAVDGLVVLGRTGSTSGLGLAIESMSDAEIDAMFALGRDLVDRWVARQLGTATAIAESRSRLLCQGASLRPEIFRENAQAMSAADFREGFRSLGVDRCVVVVGMGR